MDKEIVEGNSFQLAEIKNERDFAIRKGKVLERFAEDFHDRYYRYNPLYNKVLELLIRDADPYQIIEELIRINDEAYKHIQEITPWVSPNYHLHQNKQP